VVVGFTQPTSLSRGSDDKFNCIKPGQNLFIPVGKKLLIEDAFILPDFSSSDMTIQIQVFGSGGEEDDFVFPGSLAKQTKLGNIEFGPYHDKAIVVVAHGLLCGLNLTFE
jgi:hypothetical protein